MNASTEWLSAFVDTGLAPDQLRDLLTARVATVDAVEPVRGDLSGVVVGTVVSAERHPDSDHLWMTKVDAGGPELLDVVCGAPNVTVGTRYPFAPTGTVMPNGMKIERRKIRGQVSNGMLCSARELLLSEAHEGILPLDTTVANGTPLLQAFPLIGDTRLVIDVLPNRPDLLSHLGVARELAAATQRPLRDPHADVAKMSVWKHQRFEAHGMTDGVKVSVDERTDAPAYMGVVIRGVTIGPSPSWLASRLNAVGLRPINNVVDVTNYMLHGYGQPMHAFDLAKLAGSEVRVRRAHAGEKIRTLDGVDRVLDSDMIVIADTQNAQAVAGVIGGSGSEVTDATTDIFLEIATFDPRRVRAAKKTLGVSTDASYRFERLVPVSSPEATYELATRLILATAGGGASHAPVLIAGPPATPLEITLRIARVATVIGVAIDAQTCAELLSSIGFRTAGDNEALVVVVPPYRTDVTREIDLIEEVARLYGYERVPETLRPFRPSTVPDDPLVAVMDRVRIALVEEKFFELRPMPFVAAREGAALRVVNPLSEQEAALRGDLLSTLAKRADFNVARGHRNLRLFEIGTAFSPPVNGARPLETMRVAALAMGTILPRHFRTPAPPAWEEWDAKALAEILVYAAFPGAKTTLIPSLQNPVLWNIYVNDQCVGLVRDVHLASGTAYGVELTLQKVMSDDLSPSEGHRHLNDGVAERRFVPQYEAISTQPAAWIDVNLLVPDSVDAEKVEEVMRKVGAPLLESLELISLYDGEQIPAGERSLTWRLTFRDPERTLVEKQVEARRDKLVRTLGVELGVRQRTA